MIVGTSAMVQTELDCIVNQYTDKFCNPMVMWGKYRKRLLKTTLPISFQFHHVQMDYLFRAVATSTAHATLNPITFLENCNIITCRFKSNRRVPINYVNLC